MNCTDCKGTKVYQPMIGDAEDCARCDGTGLEPEGAKIWDGAEGVPKEGWPGIKPSDADVSNAKGIGYGDEVQISDPSKPFGHAIRAKVTKVEHWKGRTKFELEGLPHHGAGPSITVTETYIGGTKVKLGDHVNITVYNTAVDQFDGEVKEIDTVKGNITIADVRRGGDARISIREINQISVLTSPLMTAHPVAPAKTASTIHGKTVKLGDTVRVRMLNRWRYSGTVNGFDHQATGDMVIGGQVVDIDSITDIAVGGAVPHTVKSAAVCGKAVRKGDKIRCTTNNGVASGVYTGKVVGVTDKEIEVKADNGHGVDIIPLDIICDMDVAFGVSLPAGTPDDTRHRNR